MQKHKVTLTSEERKRLDELKKEISHELDALQSLGHDKKVQKNIDIISMIRHYIDMSDKVEDRRVRTHTFALQMLAIWVSAAIVLTSLYLDENVKINPIFFVASLSLFIGQILFCLYSAYIYEKQSGFRYAFLWPEAEGYGNRWKWFYYGSRSLQRISTETIRQSKTFDTTVEPYLESCKEFIGKYAAEDLPDEIVNNIQQLHLLRVHNYYKNKFFLQLTEIRKWSLYAMPVSIAIGVIIGLVTGG